MHTIQLKVKNSAYDKLLKLLSSFSKDEIEVLPNTKRFQKDQSYLLEELNEIESGNATFVSQNEFEERLNHIVERHEDHL